MSEVAVDARSRGALIWPASIVLLAAAYAAKPLSDPDLFWHLTIGRIILDQRAPLRHDPLTFTAGHREWIQHEWLSQVVLAAAERTGGLVAVRLFASLAVAVVLTLLFFAFRRAVPRRPLASGALLFIAWWAFRPTVAPRPHVIGWIFAALLFAVWWARARDFRLDLIVTALITIAWVNFHSSALLAPIAASLTTVETIVYRRRDESVRWLTKAALTWAAVCVSPSGWRLIGYALYTTRINVRSEEWQSLFDSTTWATQPLLPLLGASLFASMVIIGVRRWRERPAVFVFPGVFFAAALLVMAFQYRRMIAFAFVPLLAAVSFAEEEGLLDRLDAGAVRGAIRQLLAIALAVATVSVALVGIRADMSAPSLEEGAYPEKATEFLDAVSLRGNMLNLPEWGGYLSWRLYPRYKTFADGRWDLIGPRTLADGVSLLLHSNREPLLRQYSIDYVIQPSAQFVASPPMPASEWSLAWIDPVAIVVLRRGDLYEANRRALCAAEAMHPEWRDHLRWPFRIPVKTDLPPIDCSPAAAASTGEHSGH